MEVAIILDGDLKSALAAVRSLGRADIAVVAGATRPSAMALKSTYVDDTFIYPDPRADRTAFLVAVKGVAERWQQRSSIAPVLFCFSDATFTTLAEAAPALHGLVSFPVPTKDSITVAFDKQKTTELAKRHGVRTIRELELSQADRFTYPVILKPRQSVTWNERRGVFRTAEFVTSTAALIDRYEALQKTTGASPLIQACLWGEEYGVELLCENGEVLASFVHQRIRSLSPTGGASVVKQTAPSITLTDAMKTQSVELARALNWTGPMMVEWKVEVKTDLPYLMEINGRFWGSLPLAVAAGIDFPLWYYYLARGKEQKIPRSAGAEDVRTRHFWGDVRWLSRVWFDRTPLRVTHYPSRVKALWLFMVEFFRSQGDVWDWGDLRPAFFELIDIVKR